MSRMEEHPSVVDYYRKRGAAGAEKGIKGRPHILSAAWLREVCREAGADDAGFVDIDRPALSREKDDILAYFPHTKTLIGIVCRMNREPIRSPARSVSNLEFHHIGDKVNEAARRIVSVLEEMGIRAVNPSMGFPMEMDNFPEKIWVVSHKTVAVEAGLGHMGIHHNVIHPEFGNFILLGTVLVDAGLESYDSPIDYNPCLECKLCVAACPVGAITPDGHFNFSSCYTHNYREFMGGFTSWVEGITESGSAREYRRRFTDSESASMWQSLSFGANYKAAYCMAVCPAGEDVIGPFLENRKAYLDDVLRPLQNKAETVYVVPESDAQAHVAKRFPNKTAKAVSNGLRPKSVATFLDSLPLVFQREKSDGLDATYHFTFTGEEQMSATVIIRNKSVEVLKGLNGTPDLVIYADSRTWLGFISKEHGIIVPILLRKIRIKGRAGLLKAFGRCFPS
ncbi:MAG: SCP2 sterol-binding domain-containing protein [Candidatus Dadabacteria bacterium]|jgi:ferredoxin|nr:SCP2 sterol-binding domain-containing protein [Candidatus Dadabacteria bacterium]